METLTLVQKHPIFGWVDSEADLADGEAILLGIKQVQRFHPADVRGPNLNGTYAVFKPCGCCDE